MAEVYEVASFYDHFDIVKEGETPPPPLTVRVCDSLTCEMMGAERLARRLAGRARAGRARDPGALHGRLPPCARRGVGHALHEHASVESVAEAVRSGDTHPHVPTYIDFDSYRAGAATRCSPSASTASATVEDVIKTLEDSGLRGLGGAGFPTGRKWRFVRAEPGPRLMAVNIDEGEPGTFKDRIYLETDPAPLPRRHADRRLGGRGRGGLHLPARRIPAVPRDPAARDREGRGRGAGAPHRIHLRRGAGAYICGEESAMLESIEGKRGCRATSRRSRARSACSAGRRSSTTSRRCSGCATSSSRARTGSRSRAATAARACARFSVSGRVQHPGVKLAPAGITVRELIDEYCGGMPDGHAFYGYLPGGASGGILPASMGDIPLDFGTLEPHGCFIGSAAVIVLSDQDDMREVALNLMQFFEDESCGQCTPCRVGTEKAVTLMERPQWDETLLERAVEGDDRRLDLRARPGRPEPGQAGLEALPGRPRSRSGASAAQAPDPGKPARY